MNKLVIGVVAAVIIIGGGFAVIHKSSMPTTNSTTSNPPAASNAAVLTTKSSSSVGQYLAASNGMALYTYAGDSSGVSAVTGGLLASWPAYVDTGSTTNLPSGVSTIKRTDNGQTQYTYNGMPLYFFTADSAGQVTGNNISNFKVATPAAASPQPQPATTTPPPSSSANPY